MTSDPPPVRQGLAGTALIRRKPRLLLLAPLAGYAPAWLGRFFVERNRPATFHSPLRSLRADLRMLRRALTGRLGDELQRLDAGARRVLQDPLAPAPR